MRRLLATAFLSAIVTAGVLSVSTEAQEPRSAPLFTAGEDYLVAWDCLPIASEVPCYMEILHVQGVRRDGWVVVKDQGGDEWTINPMRATAFMVIKPPMRAAR